MARNTLKCNLSGSERITNNSYLKKQLDRLGITEECFRYHYATTSSVSLLREDIAQGKLAQRAFELGQPEKEPSNTAWLVRVAVMNGKSKLFTSMIEKRLGFKVMLEPNVIASTTIKTVSIPSGELQTSIISSGNII